MEIVQAFVIENPGIVAAASGAAAGAIVASAWHVWNSTFAMPDLSHRAKNVETRKISSSEASKTERIILYELEHAQDGIVSVSGFCAAIDAHLQSMDIDFEIKQAFKDKFPPRGKAPFLEHYKTDGTVTTVTESDVILRYLFDMDTANKSLGLRRAIVPDAELKDTEEMTAVSRSSTIHLAKRLITDRLYFVGVQWAMVEEEGWELNKSDSQNGMPWPINALFAMFLRRTMADQCLVAAGGVGRAPYAETLRDAEGDLDALEDVVGRLGNATGWLSGEDRPSSAEIAMWGHLASCSFEGRTAPLAKAVAVRPALHKWIGAMAMRLFPDRVREVGGLPS